MKTAFACATWWMRRVKRAIVSGGARATNLDRDRMLVLALVKALAISGEAAYRITPATRQTYLDLPWEDIIGMRHRFVHAYFDIDLDILWQTIHHDLPPFITKLEAILAT